MNELVPITNLKTQNKATIMVMKHFRSKACWLVALHVNKNPVNLKTEASLQFNKISHTFSH